MSTPIAMTASKGWLGIVTVVGPGVPAREAGLPDVRDGVEPPKLRPRRSPAVEPAWTCEPAMTLRTRSDKFRACRVKTPTLNKLMVIQSSPGQIG